MRGWSVAFGRDLRRPTKRLYEPVKRNADRFPVDFVFRLSDGEKGKAAANCDRKFRGHEP